MGTDHRRPHHTPEHPFFSILVHGTSREDYEQGTRQWVSTSLIFYPEHELPKEAFVADLLGQMRTERLSYGAGSTETMTERLNLLMTPLYTWVLTQGLEIGAREIVLENACLRCLLRSEAVAPAWLESLHENCCDPIHVSDLAKKAVRRPTSCLDPAVLFLVQVVFHDPAMRPVAITFEFKDVAEGTRRGVHEQAESLMIFGRELTRQRPGVSSHLPEPRRPGDHCRHHGLIQNEPNRYRRGFDPV